MKAILEKYFRLNKDYRNSLKDIYIISVLQEEIKEHKNVKLTLGEEESLFYIIKELLEFSNIRASVIIGRLLDILECPDIELYDIEDSTLDELVELISDEDTDFKEVTPQNNMKKEIIAKFKYKDFDCVFEKDNDNFIINCYSIENPQERNAILFKNLKQLLGFIIDRKFGDNIA